MSLKSTLGTAGLAMSIATGVFFTSYTTLRVTQGSCPTTTLVSNFDPDRYLGVWYELRRDEDISFETGECVTAQYSLNDNGTVKVSNTQFFGFYDSSSDYENAVGEAQVNSWFSGRLYVYFFAMIGGDYRILDTDYDSYSIVYSCTDFPSAGIKFGEAAWVLVRN